MASLAVLDLMIHLGITRRRWCPKQRLPLSGRRRPRARKVPPPKEDDHEPIHDPSTDDDDDENAGEGANQESEPHASGEGEKVPKKRPAATAPTKKPASKGRKRDEDCAPYIFRGHSIFLSPKELNKRCGTEINCMIIGSVYDHDIARIVYGLIGSYL